MKDCKSLGLVTINSIKSCDGMNLFANSTSLKSFEAKYNRRTERTVTIVSFIHNNYLHNLTEDSSN